MYVEELKKIAASCTETDFRDALLLRISDPVTLRYVHNLVYIDSQQLSNSEVAERNRIAVGLWAACVHEWGKPPSGEWFRRLINVIGLTGVRAYRGLTLSRKANLDEVVPVTREYLYWVLGQIQAESR